MTEPEIVERLRALHCEWDPCCTHPVTHIDSKGFVYCAKHGEIRKSAHRCRKLLVREVRQLESGQPLEAYNAR